jgi:hypothetical protein
MTIAVTPRVRRPVIRILPVETLLPPLHLALLHLARGVHVSTGLRGGESVLLLRVVLVSLLRVELLLWVVLLLLLLRVVWLLLIVLMLRGEFALQSHIIPPLRRLPLLRLVPHNLMMLLVGVQVEIQVIAAPPPPAAAAAAARISSMILQRKPRPASRRVLPQSQTIFVPLLPQSQPALPLP